MKSINFPKRKVCKVNYTITVSLPKVWFENVGLKPGDYVDLTMGEDDSLILKPARPSVQSAEPIEPQDVENDRWRLKGR